MTFGRDQNFELLPVANWPIATVRTFLWDPVNGKDANQGFSDGAGPYTPATQARQTIQGMRAIFPTAFNGRPFRLIMAAGAYAQGLDGLLNGAVGIGPTSLVRGTATNATAGCVAFDDSAADRTYQGWTTCPGMNAAGYNPTGAPTTSVIQCLTAGGGGPAFPAERAYPLGARIRFDANTTTVALRNVCRMIGAVSGGDTLTTESALPAVPVASDVFYIEIGGLSFPGFTLTAQTVENSSITGALQLCGFATSGSLNLLYGNTNLVGAFVGTAPGHFLTILGAANWNEVTSFIETTTGATVQIGGCTRTSSSTSTGSGVTGSISAHVTLGDNTHGLSASVLQNISLSGTIVVPTVTLANNLNASFIAGRVTGTGSSAAVSLSGRGTIGAISITGAGAKPAIQLRANAQSYFSFTGVASGSTGNNDVGLDVTLCRNAVIVFSSVPTVTGALGDVRVAGGQIITWAQAAAGFIDLNGNQFIGASSPPPRVVATLSGLIVTDAGTATLTQLGDPGFQPAIASNSAPNPEYPTSARLISTMRVCALTGNGATPYTATLYKRPAGGAQAPTTMQVTIPGGAAVAAVVSDSAHPILFATGDTFAVQIDSAATGEGNKAMTVILEGP